MNFSDKFNFLKRDDNLIKLEYKIKRLLCENGSLSISELEKLLESINFKTSKKEIWEMMQFLSINYGCLLRDDYWNQEVRYTYLGKNYWNSDYSRNYYSISSNNTIVESFLVISDTYLGNSKLEDLKLINNIYNYALKKGIKKCFHLGNLFASTDVVNKEQIDKQLVDFTDNYPNLNEIMTYSIMGEYDKKVNEYLQDKNWWEYCDLRGLAMYNPNFYMFPSKEISTYFSNILCHFGRKLSKNFILGSVDIAETIQINERNDSLENNHIISIISNNKEIICSNSLGNKDRMSICLTVPAANKLNINKTVGYVIKFNYDCLKKINDIVVEVLTSDENRNIKMKREIIFDFKVESERYERSLKRANY